MRLLKIGWIPAVAAVLGIALTLALGNWQMRRAGQKQTLQQALVAAEKQMPHFPADWEKVDSLIHQRLVVSGKWLPEAVIYLDNRPWQGRAGFYVLMPLKIDVPPGQKEITLIVNRGWLPRDINQRTHIAAYATPAGTIEVQGIAIENEPKLLELGQGAPEKLGGIWQNFDFADFYSASQLSPVPLVLRQETPGTVVGAMADDGLIRDWPDQGSSMQAQIDRHHGYAAQWFGLSALIAFLTLFYGYRNARKPNPFVK